MKTSSKILKSKALSQIPKQKSLSSSKMATSSESSPEVVARRCVAVNGGACDQVLLSAMTLRMMNRLKTRNGVTSSDAGSIEQCCLHCDAVARLEYTVQFFMKTAC